jgi:superfamily II DNA helicase RecQ
MTKVLKFTPRGDQIEAIRTLAIDQLDLILIAPTGWGKSAVFQAIPALRGGICLMIMPLNLLEEGQVSKDPTGKTKVNYTLAIGQVYCSNIWL